MDAPGYNLSPLPEEFSFDVVANAASRLIDRVKEVGYQSQLQRIKRPADDSERLKSFWQRFAAYTSTHGGGGTPAFLRTHPLDTVRIQQIQQWMPEAKANYRPQ